MSRSDRIWEEVERRRDRMDAADLLPYQVRFADESADFGNWLDEQILAEVESDARDEGYGEPGV